MLSTAKFIFASDWDGTITTQDSNDAATDNLGFGSDKRRALNVEILNRTKHFRDGFQEMIDSVAAKVSFEEMKDYIVESKSRILCATGERVFGMEAVERRTFRTVLILVISFSRRYQIRSWIFRILLLV